MTDRAQASTDPAAISEDLQRVMEQQAELFEHLILLSQRIDEAEGKQA